MRTNSSESEPDSEAAQNESPDDQQKLSTSQLWEHTLYDELRRLAARKLAQEKPGQTLQPTALVHEAYLRIEEGNDSLQWNG